MKKLILFIALISCLSCKSKQEEKTPQSKAAMVSKTIVNTSFSGGTLHRVENFPSKFIQPRNVDVWLPENYSEQKKYAVLYMHDGQMLFDASVTWNKQEWMVDEVAEKLIKSKVTKDFIVVAMWNISEIRWQDYFPQKALAYLEPDIKDALFEEAKKDNFNLNLNADNYLKFITQELKPYIDTTYAVHTKMEDTFIAGSSMGGLISWYAVCEYPEVFFGAACISTHWPGMMPKDHNPLPEAFFSYLKANLPSPKTHKFYFDFGTQTLDQYYPQYQESVNTVFTEKGYDNSNFKNLKFEGENHSEASWQKRLDIPLTFLLGK